MGKYTITLNRFLTTHRTNFISQNRYKIKRHGSECDVTFKFEVVLGKSQHFLIFMTFESSYVFKNVIYVIKVTIFNDININCEALWPGG